MTALDSQWMILALEEAGLAAGREEVPVGAVVALGDRLLASAHNLTVSHCDPTAHAEIVALRRAGTEVAAPRLPGATLYVTLEPCLMCLGAMVHARVERLVFAASDPKLGATELFQSVPIGFHGLNHRLTIERGPGAAEAADLLRRFFQSRR